MDSKIKVFKVLTVSAIILIFLLTISLIINFVKLGNMKSTERKLQAQLDELNRRIAENDEDIAELSSDEYLDWYAREYLNMKGRDEDAFKVKNKKTKEGKSEDAFTEG